MDVTVSSPDSMSYNALQEKGEDNQWWQNISSPPSQQLLLRVPLSRLM